MSEISKKKLTLTLYNNQTFSPSFPIDNCIVVILSHLWPKREAKYLNIKPDDDTEIKEIYYLNEWSENFINTYIYFKTEIEIKIKSNMYIYIYSLETKN